MIQVKNITFSHGGSPLYENASFSLPKNKKGGLVGLNGAGKSTLFQLLLKEEWPEEGSISVEGRVMLVPQEVTRDARQLAAPTVRDYLRQARPHADEVLRGLLSNVELADLPLEARPADLSGGQKTKLALLFAVLSQPDVLLLDEPTNFLDTAGKKWVMHWLSQYKKTLLVVSHDLDLLDRAIDKVIYINKQTRSFEEYTGSYSKFKKLKADHDEHLTRYIRNEQQKIDRMKKSVERLRQSNVTKVIHQRVLLERRIQKIEDTLPQLPKEIVKIKLQLPSPAHCGELPIAVRNLHKSFDAKTVLRSVTFSVQRGQRIALIGQNGTGKSTLIKTIMGVELPDSGNVEVNHQAKIGYYSQGFESFAYDKPLMQFVAEETGLPERQLRGFLARFMFQGLTLRQTVATLSGGEKTRLAIALLMIDNNNLLILDEPTTYLDVLSQRIILDALKQYTGTMLVVSHTPEFLQELKPDRAFLLPEERLVYWEDSLAKRSAEM